MSNVTAPRLRMFIFVLYVRDQPIRYRLKLLLLNTVIHWISNIAPKNPIFFQVRRRSLVAMTTAIIKVCKFVLAKQYHLYFPRVKREKRTFEKMIFFVQDLLKDMTI